MVCGQADHNSTPPSRDGFQTSNTTTRNKQGGWRGPGGGEPWTGAGIQAGGLNRGPWPSWCPGDGQDTGTGPRHQGDGQDAGKRLHLLVGSLAAETRWRR